MRWLRKLEAAGLLAAALLAAPAGLMVSGSGGAPAVGAFAALAAPVDPNPEPMSLGQLVDEGYQCWPAGEGVVQCYRDKNSPKYECRQGVCWPADRQPGSAGLTWQGQVQPLEAQPSLAAR